MTEHPPTVRLSLFGPVTVRRDDVALPIGGDIPRAIVARLAVDAGVAVPADELVRDVWGDAPASILTSLRSHVSRLRGGPLADLLEGGRDGYRLTLEPTAIDARRIAAAADRAEGAPIDADLAAELADLERAWDGDPLADLTGFPFLETARARMRNDRLRAALALARVRLDRGENATASLGLTDIAAEHPLDDDVQTLLSTALARSGRTSDALAALDAAQREGGTLSPALADLRSRILRQEPEVLGTTAVSAETVQRTGVPIPLTPLVGRTPELEALTRARAAARLVTLVGAAGVGKTRLVVEHARAATSETDDEQWLADLTVVDRGDKVPSLLADLVGAHEADLDAIARRLSGRRVLLVLDNAEHVLDAVRSAVETLLARAVGLTIVVTSREQLGIRGERIVRIGPLDGSRLGEAVTIFEQRAQESSPGFEVNEATAELVREVCRTLDGIPLALNLAASRLDVLPLPALVRSLQRGTDLAAGSGRHGSLANAIGWSAALLEEHERDLMTQLALFVGPFTLDAVAGICESAAGDPVALTAGLVRKSLVAVTGDEGGERRYRLLDSIRAYFAQQPKTFPVEEWRARHAVWMAGFAVEKGGLLVTADARPAHIALDHARPDLQLALDTAVAMGSRPLALMLFAGQATHWFRRGLFGEGLGSAERAFAVPGEAPPPLEGRALLGRTMLAYQSGDAVSAFGYIREAARLGNESGDADLEAIALANDAYGLALLGDPTAAESLMERAVTLSEHSPAWVRGEVEMCHGQMQRGLGRPAQALRVLARARALAAEAGYRWAETSATYVTGKVLIDVGRGADAVAVLRPGVAGALASDDPTSALALLNALGGAAALLGKPEVGATLFGMVDAMGVRYEYNPVTTEGADAQSHRDRVRAALDAEAFEAAEQRGRGLGFSAALELAATL
ncbi:putative ATPase [Diaminobutyricimonas aerilata]|uniref:Putative ATPase n=1 Tax=Diaminobutyricimonas aerilata TaxID=1162967 RepID=A0A2M9CLZ7_9MICO|nr:BTAD domain-containing putative transcriptional regulator [Diaminobutyricimonas aerilata]PJJ72914.1 putative ATPase [Diaminobutyricimonas aerilata]